MLSVSLGAVQLENSTISIIASFIIRIVSS